MRTSSSVRRDPLRRQRFRHCAQHPARGGLDFKRTHRGAEQADGAGREAQSGISLAVQHSRRHRTADSIGQDQQTSAQRRHRSLLQLPSADCAPIPSAGVLGTDSTAPSNLLRRITIRYADDALTVQPKSAMTSYLASCQVQLHPLKMPQRSYIPPSGTRSRLFIPPLLLCST